MKYNRIRQGKFISRPNRFIAMVEIDGQVETCHVKNTGRCRELLVPGARVWLEEGTNPNRKTRFSLVAVCKKRPSGELLINMDSQAPNQVAEEWLKENAARLGIRTISREKKWGESRFDFYLEYTDGACGYLEVKGVTLEDKGIARFPDAPTERGARHVRELARGQKEGLRNSILFVIQMKKMRHLEPNAQTDPDFAAALCEAEEAGVEIFAMDCVVTPDSLCIDAPVPVFVENRAKAKAAGGIFSKNKAPEKQAAKIRKKEKSSKARQEGKSATGEHKELGLEQIRQNKEDFWYGVGIGMLADDIADTILGK